MSGIEALHNRGVWVLNGSGPSPASRTMIVLGAARGGTSMVAGALHHLGVAMGERLSAVFEDVALSEAVEKRDAALVDRIVARRNRLHPVWGWKRPDAVRFSAAWKEKFRNPHYVVVFRDLFAIANRNRISMHSNVIENMRHSHEQFGLILEFVAHESAPTLLVSYEKAMAHPGPFVAALRAFAAVGDQARVTKALRFIERDPEAYLKESRIAGVIGRVDKVAANRISGWAVHKQAPDRPVKVRIEINGEREYIVAAERPRPDLKKRNIHPTGERGFLLVLADADRLEPGDRVSARAVGDVADLRNSPWVFQG